MIYADSALGPCFMTGRGDVANYLSIFESFELDNPNYREKFKADLWKKECKYCVASCASNYKISFISRIILEKSVKKIFSLVQR